MKLVTIGKSWDSIPTNTRIFLPNDTEFESLDGKIMIKSGYYFISGFWANVMGVHTDRKKAQNQASEFHILSKELENFQVREAL